VENLDGLAGYLKVWLYRKRKLTHISHPRPLLNITLVGDKQLSPTFIKKYIEVACAGSIYVRFCGD
jgi:hypothetical protein